MAAGSFSMLLIIPVLGTIAATISPIVPTPILISGMILAGLFFGVSRPV
jgi:hypothetical protein